MEYCFGPRGRQEVTQGRDAGHGDIVESPRLEDIESSQVWENEEARDLRKFELVPECTVRDSAPLAFFELSEQALNARCTRQGSSSSGGLLRRFGAVLALSSVVSRGFIVASRPSQSPYLAMVTIFDATFYYLGPCSGPFRLYRKNSGRSEVRREREIRRTLKKKMRTMQINGFGYPELPWESVE